MKNFIVGSLVLSTLSLSTFADDRTKTYSDRVGGSFAFGENSQAAGVVIGGEGTIEESNFYVMAQAGLGIIQEQDNQGKNSGGLQLTIAGGLGYVVDQKSNLAVAAGYEANLKTYNSPFYPIKPIVIISRNITDDGRVKAAAKIKYEIGKNDNNNQVAAEVMVTTGF